MNTATKPTLPPTDHTPRLYDGPSYEEVLELRRTWINPGVFTYYKNPLLLAEGHMQYVWDHEGKRYLDGLAGICTVSVGHCHPEVVEALADQASRIQHAPTIYLHPKIGQFAKLLTSTLPDKLSNLGT